MNWDAIGAIGEIVGAIAVVVSLAYLAVQIKQSNAASARAAVQELLDLNDRIAESVGESEEIAEVYLKGSANEDGLSKAQQMQYNTILLRQIKFWERVYYFKKGYELWSLKLCEYIST